MNSDDQNGSDGEWDEKSDLTRIEDLSEFLHVEDDELNEKFESADIEAEQEEDLNNQGEDLLGLSDLEDDPDSFDSSPSFESETDEDEQVAGSSGFEESEGTQLEEESTPPAFEQTEEFQDSGSAFDEDTEPDRSMDELTGSFSSDSALESEDTTSSFGDDQEDVGFPELPQEEEAETTQWDSEGDEFSENVEAQDFDSVESVDDDEDSTANFSEDDQEQIEENNESSENDFSDEPIEESTSFLSEDSQQEEQESTFDLPDPEDLEASREEQAEDSFHPSAVEVIANEVPETAQQPKREDFQDLRDFGNSISYGLVQTGGNPPYSLILRQVKYEEDARDIIIILREHGLVSSENEDTISQGLEQGSLLISQISEYSAIYLAHRLRRFDLDLRIGLSDQLHPSKSYNPENKGLVSKHNLGQNFQEDVLLEDRVVHIEDIVLSTTPTIDGYSIYRYFDIVTSHTVIKEDELKRLSKSAEAVDREELPEELNLDSSVYDEYKSDGDTLMDNYSLGLNEIYHELSLELKNQAFKIESNAVVGINFALTPLIDGHSNKGNTSYKITCSGNAVWIVDQQE